MKKSFLVALAMAFPVAAVAGDMGMRSGGYGLAGCGLGSMVFESNSKVSQVFASTTNGTFGSQTFGISSGTSNCASSGVVKSEKEQEVFVSMNFNSLTEEMAQGKGETLTAFSSLLGCPADASSAFARMTQTKFSGVFSKASTPEDLLSAVKAQMASDASLAETCSQSI